MAKTTYTRFRGYDSAFLSQRQCFDGFNHQVPREVTADKTDHLVVVEAGDCVIVRRAVEHLAYLLEEALSIELSRAHERVLPQENVLASQGCVEAKSKRKFGKYKFIKVRI